MRSNSSRMSQGLDIYLDAMRRYIAEQMQREVAGDWFRDRVMGVFYKWQDEIEEDLEKGKRKEEVLEFKHFPEVICHRDNRSVFPIRLAGGKHRNSIAKLWMEEITMWRNDLAHRRMDDFSDQDADRTLDTCARVLNLVDSVAEKSVRELFHDPQYLKRELENERANYEDTKQIANRAEQFERQWKEEQKNHENTRKKLKTAKRAKSRAEEHTQKAEANLSKLRAARHTIHQNLKSEQENRRKIEQERDQLKQQLESCEEARQQLEVPRPPTFSKPTGVPAEEKVGAYSNKFVQTRSGNGRSRRLLVEKDEDWFVTLWVAETKSGGKPRACVFSPWKSSSSGLKKAGDEPLIDQPCNSEEEAFAHLQRAEQSGEIERLARQAIEDYEPPDSGPDDDIPF